MIGQSRRSRPTAIDGDRLPTRRTWSPDVPWDPLRRALLAAYAVGYVWWFLVHGVIVDRISVLISVALFLVVASIGRPPQRWLVTLGDVTVVVAMWIAYDESRGAADSLGFPVQVESVRDLDRLLFLGADPVVWLQGTFHRGPDDVRWYDVVGSIVYYSHFVVPPATIAVLWLRDRAEWTRYLRRFATVLFVACTVFVVAPTAPPWMAAGGENGAGLELDALPPLSRPTAEGWRHVGLDAFVAVWDHGRDWANQVAAVPSLHAAFALLVVVFFWPRVRSRRWRVVMALYPLTMAVALVYFAEHYVVDVLAGWAVVGASVAVWNRVEATAEQPVSAPVS